MQVLHRWYIAICLSGKFAVLIAIAFGAPAASAECRQVDQSNTLATIISDMEEPHEGTIRGVMQNGDDPLSWMNGPRVSYGNTLPVGWNATIPWGQVYADASGHDNSSIRFQIRRLQQWVLLRSNNSWVSTHDESDAIVGANYAEDFRADENAAADIRKEPNLGGGISATIAPGYNFHFFPAERTEIDPDDIAGVWSVFEARLLPGQSPMAYDATLLASGGGDYWEAVDSQWDQWTTNGDWAIGRFKYLTPIWQSFNAHTLKRATLRRNPPPFR